MITTVCSGLMIIDLNTCTNTVLCPVKSPGVADRVATYTHKCNPALVISGASPRVDQQSFPSYPVKVCTIGLVPSAYYNTYSCILESSATHKVTPTRRYLLRSSFTKTRDTHDGGSWLTRLQPIAMQTLYVVITVVCSQSLQMQYLMYQVAFSAAAAVDLLV